MTLPTFCTYGNYSNSNYGAHALVFTDAQGNDFFFSYKTLVAFTAKDGRRRVLQNYWGPTTGKHLNAIDGGNKKARLSREQFEACFEETYGQKIAA